MLEWPSRPGAFRHPRRKAHLRRVLVLYAGTRARSQHNLRQGPRDDEPRAAAQGAVTPPSANISKQGTRYDLDLPGEFVQRLNTFISPSHVERLWMIGVNEICLRIEEWDEIDLGKSSKDDECRSDGPRFTGWRNSSPIQRARYHSLVCLLGEKPAHGRDPHHRLRGSA